MDHVPFILHNQIYLESLLAQNYIILLSDSLIFFAKLEVFPHPTCLKNPTPTCSNIAENVQAK
jgi:hypothetical protein